MVYRELQLISVATLKEFKVVINLDDVDSSTIDMLYVKVSPQKEVLESKHLTVSYQDIRQIIPDMEALITYVADKYNPFDPQNLPPEDPVQESWANGLEGHESSPTPVVCE